MSKGLVICSTCGREVHQKGWIELSLGSRVSNWVHCEDQTPMCNHSYARYPKDKSEIAGKFCGMDDL